MWCIDRVTRIDHITWHRSHDMLDFVTPPVLTQEDTDVRACTSDANLIAPTSTNMLHSYEQRLLIRHSHYSIWKLCWFHFIHQSESSVLDRVEAWTAIITATCLLLATQHVLLTNPQRLHPNPRTTSHTSTSWSSCIIVIVWHSSTYWYSVYWYGTYLYLTYFWSTSHLFPCVPIFPHPPVLK